MRLKIDREKVIKYADKAFLGLALVFLILAAALWYLSGGKPKLTYSTIKSEYRSAQTEMQKATTPDYIKGTLLKDDVSLQELAFSSPAYDKNFIRFQENQSLPKPWLQAPISAAGGAWAPYRAIAEGGVRTTKLARLSDMEHRVAPTGLRARADMGYSPSGKETQGIPGDERFYITLQWRTEFGQQTLWSREAANADANSVLDAAIVSTIPSGYDVEVQQLKADGTWPASWQPLVPGRDQVTNDMVNPRAGLQRLITLPDGDPQVLYGDAKKGDEYRKAFEAVKANIIKYQKLILQPPFFPLAGLPDGQILPFDEGDEPEAGPGDEGTGGILPPAGRESGALAPANDGALENAAREPEGVPGRAKPGFRSQRVDAYVNHLLTERDAGKIFRYRVRMRFLNPIFGVPANVIDPKAPKEGWQVEVVGPWSEPSSPVTLPPVVRYYFTSQVFGSKANFTLFRWKYGEWYTAKGVSVGVGDAITTERSETIRVKDLRGLEVKLPQKMKISYDTGGVVVVDLTTGEALVPGVGKRPSQKVILYDPVTGTLESRLAENDKLAADKFARESGQPPPVKKVPVPGPGPGPGPGRERVPPVLVPGGPWDPSKGPPPPEFQPPPEFRPTP